MHEGFGESMLRESLEWGGIVLQAVFTLVLSSALRVLLLGTLFSKRFAESAERSCGPAAPGRRADPGAFTEEIPVVVGQEYGLQLTLALCALTRPGVEN